MDYMREGIHLRGMAQKDPLVEYRNEGAAMFQELNGVIRAEVVTLLFHAQVEPGDPSGDGSALPEPASANGGANGGLAYEHQSLAGAQAIAAAGGTSTAAVAGGSTVSTGTVVKSDHENIGRNDPCWCGSGKKFKRCHGA
jgi:preprotein translocase subunit SecA